MVARKRTAVNESGGENADTESLFVVEMIRRRDYNRRPMRTIRGRWTVWACGVLLVGILTVPGCFWSASNRPPVAVFSASPREGYAPLSVLLDAGGTYDPDGDAVHYAWSLDNGRTATGRTIVHSFPEGTHEVILRVTDGRDGSDEATKTITARPVPDGYVVRAYEWKLEGEPQVWNALLPYDLYLTYRGRYRTPFVDNYNYEDYVLDPLDDPTMLDLADVLWNLASSRPDEFVARTLAFVQGAIDYAPDPPDKEWPLYPLETLVDGVGDCEDTAILLVSLLRAKGIACRLATVDTDGDGHLDHVLALVEVSAETAASLSCSTGVSLTILEIDGALHAVAETAVESESFPLGCDPWGLDPEDVIETWSF